MGSSSPSSPGNAIGLDQLIALNDEIVALVRGGVPLELGLARLGQDQASTLSRISSRLAGRMSGGQSLSEALAAEGSRLPRVYRTVVDAGIRSGRLPAALEAVSRYASALVDLRQKIGLAFLYPLVVVLLAYGLMVVVSADLTQRFLEVYRAFHITLPLVLRIMDQLARSAIYWAWIPPVVILFMLLWWARTGSTRLLQLRGVARPLGWVPGMKKVSFCFRCANFADLLALLIGHEVPLPEGIVLAADATGDRALQAAARVAAEATRQGKPLAEDLPGIDGLPPYLRWLIVRGDKQGNLASSLKMAADAYRRRAVDQAEWLKLSFPILACVVIGGGTTLLYALTLFLPLVDLLWGLAA